MKTSARIAQLLCQSSTFLPHVVGTRDRVKCFYCNGGLQNWRQNDNPWEEHAKWYPTCEFLLQQRGPEFVHNVVARFPNLSRPSARSPGQDVPPRSQYVSKCLKSFNSLAENWLSLIFLKLPELGRGQRIITSREGIASTFFKCLLWIADYFIHFAEKIV